MQLGINQFSKMYVENLKNGKLGGYNYVENETISKAIT